MFFKCQRTYKQELESGRFDLMLNLRYSSSMLLSLILKMRTISIAFSTGLLALCAADNTLDLYQNFPRTANGQALGAYNSTAGSPLLNCIDRRQLAKNPFSVQGILGGGMPKVGPVKRVELQPSGKRAGAKRTKIYFGPHTIPKKGVVSL
jgi:hypothetical protein